MPETLMKNSPRKFIDNAIQIAKMLPKGFRLAIENSYPECYSMLCSPEEIFSFLETACDYDNLGLLMDMGHLNVSSNSIGFDKHKFLLKLFARFNKKIFEIHVSSNNGHKDSHSMSRIDSFEIQFLCDNFGMINDVPIVLEWHQDMSSEAYAEYEKIANSLSI